MSISNWDHFYAQAVASPAHFIWSDVHSVDEDTLPAPHEGDSWQVVGHKEMFSSEAHFVYAPCDQPHTYETVDTIVDFRTLGLKFMMIDRAREEPTFHQYLELEDRENPDRKITLLSPYDVSANDRMREVADRLGLCACSILCPEPQQEIGDEYDTLINNFLGCFSRSPSISSAAQLKEKYRIYFIKEAVHVTTVGKVETSP